MLNINKSDLLKVYTVIWYIEIGYCYSQKCAKLYSSIEEVENFKNKLQESAELIRTNIIIEIKENYVKRL